MNKQQYQCNEAGFTVIEVILIISAAALISVAGWWIYEWQTNPYWDWKTVIMSSVKLKFAYPSDWKINVDNSPALTGEISNDFEVTSPDGFTVDVNAENIGHPSLDGPTTTLFTPKVTFDGRKGYLDFFGVGSNAKTVDQASLSQSDYYVFDVFTGKLHGTVYNIGIVAVTKSPETVAAMKASTDYTDFVKFVESAKYVH